MMSLIERMGGKQLLTLLKCAKKLVAEKFKLLRDQGVTSIRTLSGENNNRVTRTI